MIVFSSRGSPTTIRLARSANFAANAAYDLRWTSIRLPAVQRSPLLLKIMNSAASRARSMSASSKTTNGLLPPSSMLNFFNPAAWTMRLPVTVEPVKEIAATSGWRQRGSPASLPKPWTT